MLALLMCLQLASAGSDTTTLKNGAYWLPKVYIQGFSRSGAVRFVFPPDERFGRADSISIAELLKALGRVLSENDSLKARNEKLEGIVDSARLILEDKLAEYDTELAELEELILGEESRLDSLERERQRLEYEASLTSAERDSVIFKLRKGISDENDFLRREVASLRDLLNREREQSRALSDTLNIVRQSFREFKDSTQVMMRRVPQQDSLAVCDLLSLINIKSEELILQDSLIALLKSQLASHEALLAKQAVRIKALEEDSTGKFYPLIRLGKRTIILTTDDNGVATISLYNDNILEKLWALIQKEWFRLEADRPHMSIGEGFQLPDGLVFLTSKTMSRKLLRDEEIRKMFTLVDALP